MLISIIIPAYNVEHYIDECIHSAFSQTWSLIEVICIDNNSTDKTWQKLEQLKIEYPKLIKHKELKPGAPAARNKGLSLAKGEWIQFLDADDLLMPDKIEHQITLIKDDYSFIAGACIKRDISDKETTVIPVNNDEFKALFNTQLGNTCSNLWNKKHLNKIGGWNENLKSSQETDIMYRLLQKNEKILFDNIPLTIVREREFGQISSKNKTTNLFRYIQLRFQIYLYLKEIKKLSSSDLSYFERNIFQKIRLLTTYSPKQGINAYKKFINGTFIPDLKLLNYSNKYITLFQLGGYTAIVYYEVLKKRYFYYFSLMLNKNKHSS